MWHDSYVSVCRAHPDLVAVYESPRAALALLLRHTMVPLPDEWRGWRAETRQAKSTITRSLRAAGCTAELIVLQWLSLRRIALILRHWACRYEGDPSRHGQLTRVVERRLTDHQFLTSLDPKTRASGAAPSQEPRGSALGDTCQGLLVGSDLGAWYRAMTPLWSAVRPPVRRRLLLRTHRWIIERVLAPFALGAPACVEDLRPGGLLTTALIDVLPPSAVDPWLPWIHLIVADLARSLAQLQEERADMRWLFLVPRNVLVRSSRSLHVHEPGDTLWCLGRREVQP